MARKDNISAGRIYQLRNRDDRVKVEKVFTDKPDRMIVAYAGIDGYEWRGAVTVDSFLSLTREPRDSQG